MSSTPHARNPFGATKAVDLNDSQIQNLWVDVLSIGEELSHFAHPNSAMPSLVLGAKGSGKTHLMRYHSFELQMLRYGANPTVEEIQTGVANDGYIGIYALCGSINSSRFRGKRQSEEKWREIFAYYLELWLSHHLLQVVEKLQLGDDVESTLCAAIYQLFDRPLTSQAQTIRELGSQIAALQRDLDYRVNNAVMTGTLDVEIIVTRGRLIFGIPRLLASHCAFLKNALFVYAIDEFENLTIEQQQVINSLIRDKQIPATFRIGARLYGVKTYRTDGSEEENLKDSEYEVIALDRIFRAHKKNYATFARSLVSKRLATASSVSALSVAGEAADWAGMFESVDDRWSSDYYASLMKNKESPHFKEFRTKLRGVSEGEADRLVEMMAVTEYPLLEKLNLLRFYKQAHRKVNRLEIAERVMRECREFLQGPGKSDSYATALDHYKSDLIAQIYRENGSKQLYLGLDTFVLMSSGLPRALLTILRSVFDWSTFNGEDPLRTGRISIDAQYRGVRDASDWFYENMRKTSGDGHRIQAATDRLARLFRVNRFSDRPAEVSLCAFAIAEQEGSDDARHVLRLAEERSFLNRISSGGRKDKNSGAPLAMFQLSPMLAPRWDLPLARRGVPQFTGEELDAIFAPVSEEQFDRIINDWKARTSFSVASSDADTTPSAQGQLL
jgi:hypothetical protein